MSRERTGGLFQRNGQWYARFRTEKDGETIRIVRALHTDSKQVARAKLARLLNEELPPDAAARGETFAEAARRVADAQTASGRKSWKAELARLETHVFLVLGPMSVSDIRARHITELLENVTVKVGRTDKQAAPSRQTLKNILSAVSVVLDDLWRKEQLPENVAKRVRLPKSDRQVGERAVLDDFELARYLAWQHPDKRAQVGVLERQTMSCIARLFGGVRTGDLHALDWSSLDTANGRFEWGYAPRKKTAQPQRLTIDEMLGPSCASGGSTPAAPARGWCSLPSATASTVTPSKGEKARSQPRRSIPAGPRAGLRFGEARGGNRQAEDGLKVTVYQWVQGA